MSVKLKGIDVSHYQGNIDYAKLKGNIRYWKIRGADLLRDKDAHNFSDYNGI